MATQNTGEWASVLTLDELAILEMTSPSQIPQGKENETVIITTKDAYLWAVLFSQLVSSERDHDPDWFLEKFRAVLERYRSMLSPYGLRIADWENGAVHDLVFRDTAKACDMDFGDLRRRANKAYESLVQKKLIEDPFKKIVSTVVLAVLGLVPTGFTSTTEPGGVFKKEVHGVMWSYEHERDKNHKETEKAEFKLVKFINAIQPKLVDAFDETISGDKPPAAKK